jgi:glycosyltransferase involved in cell wall biosynthesis
MNPPRVLMIAEAANPEWVSVPLVGWSQFEAMARITPVHLVTQVRNREAILKTGRVEGRDFTAIDSEAVARRMWRLGEMLRGGAGKGWTTSTAAATFAYYYFEKLLWEQFGRRIESGEFDVVHRVTPLSPTTPSIIAEKCRRAGVPFVLGPLNGGVPWPAAFDSARRKEREWLSYVREMYRLLPGYRSTRAHASAILIASRDTFQQMPRTYHDKCFYLPENAIDPTRFARRRTKQAKTPIHAVFLGRLVPYKGADMLLEASADLVKAGKLTVTILGDGPQMPELKDLVARHGIADGVRLVGWVEHSKVQDFLTDADVFAFPSVREFGGGVVLEAMAVGVPAAVLDYGGPAELVTEKTGWLIPMGNRASVITNFKNLLTTLIEQPEQIDTKAPAALQRAHERFTWDAKARQTLEVYRWVMGIGPKPVFPMPTPD